MIKACQTDRSVQCGQLACAGQESMARKNLLSSFMFIQGESDGRKKVWAGNVLLLFRRVMKGESEEGSLLLCGTRSACTLWTKRMRL